ncbi:MAG TPA: sigma 54-interacting transcriptional regulator [Bryobacteraceae bacterium]
MNRERHHENFYKVLRMLTTCLGAAPYAVDEQNLFQTVCDILVAPGLFQLAWFGYAAGDGRRVGEPVACSGDRDGFLEDLKSALSQGDYEDPASIAIRTADSCWITHLSEHPGLGLLRAAFRRCAYTSVISVAVKSKAGAYGAVTVYYSDPEAFDQGIVSAMKERIAHIQAVFAERAFKSGPRSEDLETELRNLIDVLPVQLGLFDANGELLHLNRRVTEDSGYTREDIVFRGAARKLQHPDDYERVHLIVVTGIASGQPFTFEVRNFLVKEQRYHWFFVYYAPIRDENRQIIRWCAVGLDIEERKQAEEKIRQSEREARQLVDLSPLHITLLGPDGNPIYNNRAALDYFGLTLEAWQQSDTRSLIHPQDTELWAVVVPRRFLEGMPFEVEMRLRRRDGQYRWFQYRFSPMVDEEGRIARWYGAGTDIDDRKAAERRLQDENVSLREEIDKASMFEEILGTSEPLKQVVSRVSKVAPTESGVLITGETGTGKELVARAIHRLSRRSKYPFLTVNCAAIPRDLIASELFGHEKGAFTGATQRRPGRFELAAGGTIFLDEVGELPIETQAALLRVLQEHEFERVGGAGSIKTDVRVLAATNRDLEAAIVAGTFRSDLFYRLNIFPIEMPPLRERGEDIPLLVEYFLDRYARKAGKTFRAVDRKSLELLQSYPWPGNVRELQNVIERSVIVSEAETFSVDESWLSRQPRARSQQSQPDLSRRPASAEKKLIEAALRECRGRVSGSSGAAAKLGIPGSTLESKIRALKIDKSRFRMMAPSHF